MRKIWSSQASKVMHNPLFPMLFPSLGAHISGAEFQYLNNIWKEPTSMMANMIAKSVDNNGKLSCFVEAIREIRFNSLSKKNLLWIE